MPQPKRPHTAATAQAPTATVQVGTCAATAWLCAERIVAQRLYTAATLPAPLQEVEAALCSEAASFLQADAQEFARQVGLYLTSGLSVKAFDELVFGSSDEHAAPHIRKDGGPADGAQGSAAGLGDDAGGSVAGSRGRAGDSSQKRRASTDVIDLVEDSDGGADDFGYEQYSDEG